MTEGGGPGIRIARWTAGPAGAHQRRNPWPPRGWTPLPEALTAGGTLAPGPGRLRREPRALLAGIGLWTWLFCFPCFGPAFACLFSLSHVLGLVPWSRRRAPRDVPVPVYAMLLLWTGAAFLPAGHVWLQAIAALLGLPAAGPVLAWVRGAAASSAAQARAGRRRRGRPRRGLGVQRADGRLRRSFPGARASRLCAGCPGVVPEADGSGGRAAPAARPPVAVRRAAFVAGGIMHSAPATGSLAATRWLGDLSSIAASCLAAAPGDAHPDRALDAGLPRGRLRPARRGGTRRPCSSCPGRP